MNAAAEIDGSSSHEARRPRDDVDMMDTGGDLPGDGLARPRHATHVQQGEWVSIGISVLPNATTVMPVLVRPSCVHHSASAGRR